MPLDSEIARALASLAREPGGAGSAVRLELPARVEAVLLAEDLASRRGQEYTLTESGRAWLRRRAARQDPFREQHQIIDTAVLERGSKRERRVTVNASESPLGWLRSRKDRSGRPLITPEQFAAGERLRADHWRAHLSPRVTPNWGASAPSRRTRRSGASPAHSIADDVIAAKTRFARAIEAVGPELAGVLVAVCCELQGLEQAEKEESWPQRAGKVVLHLALTRLARHYGFIPQDAPPRRAMRHWGSPDFRPSLDEGG